MSCGCGGECGCDSLTLPVLNGTNGLPGQDGVSPTVTVGAPVILPAGSTPTVSDIGIAPNVVLEFGLSTGAPGTNGTNGTNGVSSFTTTTTAFNQPAVGGFASCVVADASWMAMGQPIQMGGTAPGDSGNFYILSADPIGNLIQFRNPGAADNYPTGIATNDAPGTAIPIDTMVVARGRDGVAGAAGAAGATGATGVSGTVEVVLSVPVSAPTAGAETQIYYNAAATPPTHTLYFWDGAVWNNRGSLDGARGSNVYPVVADPNTTPPSGAANGDWAIRTDIANEVNYYYRSGGAWALLSTITGASGSSLIDSWRAGKLAAQPLSMGSTTATVIVFEDTTSVGRYAYGAWNGTEATLSGAPPTPMTFTLENLIVENLGVAETKTFDVDILVNGASFAAASITVTSPALTGTLNVLRTASMAVAAGDEIRVEIAPTVGTTSQWTIQAPSIVFYNVTA
jgi:hypothetical protein